MWRLGVPALDLVIRSAAIYLALLVGLRAFGKREVGQFTLFDLILVLLVANAVQPAMTGPDSSLTGGIIIMATLFIMNFLIALLRLKSPFFRRLSEGVPTIIGKDGAWLDAQMAREGLRLEECKMALREHGIADIGETRLVVLETDGTISVVPKNAEVQRGRRRIRERRL